MTRPETWMNILQIKFSMELHEKIHQVKQEICQSSRETAHVQLEATAYAENP
jgi:hypothetical protein